MIIFLLYLYEPVLNTWQINDSGVLSLPALHTHTHATVICQGKIKSNKAHWVFKWEKSGILFDKENLKGIKEKAIALTK